MFAQINGNKDSDAPQLKFLDKELKIQKSFWIVEYQIFYTKLDKNPI